MKQTVLILGGTTEAYALASRLTARSDRRVITSLAGRTSNPRLPAGECRIGGFGGPDGLADYIRQTGVTALVDATHPFASRMGWNAWNGADLAGIPLLRLERPAWVAGPQDRWHLADNWDSLATLTEQHARRALLAVGRQELAPFARLDHVWFLIRSVDAPTPMPPFAQAQLLLARGPFGLDDERALLDTHQIDTIICKNSGGTATDAKLTAARERGATVIMLSRPPRPDAPQAADVDQAMTWLTQCPESK